MSWHCLASWYLPAPSKLAAEATEALLCYLVPERSSLDPDTSLFQQEPQQGGTHLSRHGWRPQGKRHTQSQLLSLLSTENMGLGRHSKKAMDPAETDAAQLPSKSQQHPKNPASFPPMPSLRPQMPHRQGHSGMISPFQAQPSRPPKAEGASASIHGLLSRPDGKARILQSAAA